MIRKSMFAALAMAAAGAVPVPALALTGATPDSIDTNVALVRFVFPDGVLGICSGTLIAPDVVLTAGHCAVDVSNVRVSFDFLTPGDPEEANISGEEKAARLAHYISGGIAIPDPAFDGTLAGKGHDQAVIKLPQGSVHAKYPGILPALLPPAGFLDGNNNALKNSIFTLVGYGADIGDNRTQILAVQRNMTIAPLRNIEGESITFQINANNANGGGGTCFGDSGGPAFLNGYVVGTTSFVNSLSCNGTGSYQRTDTTHSRAFLDSVLN